MLQAGMHVLLYMDITHNLSLGLMHHGDKTPNNSATLTVTCLCFRRQSVRINILGERAMVKVPSPDTEGKESRAGLPETAAN
eukprot:1189727-Prorocentrum_minimum.AAC.2